MRPGFVTLVVAVLTACAVDRLLTVECYENNLDDLRRFFSEAQD